jgi:hypothetical protein
VVPNVAAGLARRSDTGHLLGAQKKDLFQHLMADLVDHGFYDLARTLDQIQDGKQDLSVGLAELLNYGGALTGSASNDVVWFLHGGRLLSVFLRLATGFYRIGANRRLPTFNYDRDTLRRAARA